MHSLYTVGGVLATLSLTQAITLDIGDQASIRSAAKVIAGELLDNYSGNQPGNEVGLFSSPYYFWEAGAVWDGLINYWALTGDASYNSIVEEALLAQQGSNHDYMPANQTMTLGNDDQAVWALAALTAAERNLPSSSSSQAQWIALAEAVFNEQVARWDTATCGGGLRWQIFAFNAGYDYKNAWSQGAFFQLAARLAVATGNTTYSDWAEKTWTWAAGVGLITSDYAVYDGTSITDDCANINRLQWTATTGLFLYGSGVMYNLTDGAALWRDRTTGLLNAASVFFENSIMTESTCESARTCNTDQLAYKALLSRWMGLTTVVAPFTDSQIRPLLEASAQAAAASCSGETSGTLCGASWVGAAYDGSSGVGQQLSALEVIQANLVGGDMGLSKIAGVGVVAGASTVADSPTAVASGTVSSTAAASVASTGTASTAASTAVSGSSATAAASSTTSTSTTVPVFTGGSTRTHAMIGWAGVVSVACIGAAMCLVV